MKESGEMYLETILKLAQVHPEVHAVQIAEEMKISKPSVSRALSHLNEGGYVIVDQKGRIAFTEKGRQIAEKIYERHQVLTKMLMSLGVDEENAAADACKMEHDISDATYEAMKRHTTLHSGS